MTEVFESRPRFGAMAWRVTVRTLLLASGLVVTSPATAQDAQDAKQVLKAMSDYVTSQKNISFAFDSTITRGFGTVPP